VFKNSRDIRDTDGSNVPQLVQLRFGGDRDLNLPQGCGGICIPKLWPTNTIFFGVTPPAEELREPDRTY
jgi:hypothetical protein